MKTQERGARRRKEERKSEERRRLFLKILAATAIAAALATGWPRQFIFCPVKELKRTDEK